MTDKKITFSLLIFSVITLVSFFALFNLFNKSVRPVFSATTHVVISQVQVGGTTAGDEFVEIYNPTENIVDLTGWRLKVENTTNTSSSTLFSGITKTIPSHTYFLVGSPTYSGSVAADETYTATSSAITANNTIILFSGSTPDTFVDKVGMGTATDNETTDIAAPSAGGSIQRKLDTTEAHATDTDDNSSDFETLLVSDPRNSSTIIASPSVAPSPSTTPTGSPVSSPSPSSLASSSPSTSPSVIPSVSPSPSSSPSGTPSASPSSNPSSSPSVIPSSSPSVAPSPSSSPSVNPSSSPLTSPSPLPSGNPVIINTPFFSCTLKFFVLNKGFFKLIFPVFTCTSNI